MGNKYQELYERLVKRIESTNMANCRSARDFAGWFLVFKRRAQQELSESFQMRERYVSEKETTEPLADAEGDVE